MKDKVLVNVATYGREDYPTIQDRMIYNFKSMGWDGDYLMFSDRPRIHETGVEVKDVAGIVRSQQEMPYAFKGDVINEARASGYKKVIWADSTILMQKDLNQLFNEATVKGIVAFHNLGHDLAPYISDEAAEYLEILNDPNFEKIKQIMACSMIFDFNNPVAVEIFEIWHGMSWGGVFKETGSKRANYKGHRHDQAVMSALLYKFDIPLNKYGDLVYEPHNVTKEYGDPFLLNKGI